MLNNFSQQLNIDFLKENWYYKINYLGFANIISDSDIERHYYFESHGEKFDLYIDTEGTLNCKKFDTIPICMYGSYKIVVEPKLERYTLEDYLEKGRTKARKALVEKFGDNDDYDNALDLDHCVCFDKVVIIYDKNKIVCTPYYGVNEIEDITFNSVSKEEFLEYLENF